MDGCPNSTASGCRCVEHHPGLSVHAVDPIAYEAMLASMRPALRVVTPGPPLSSFEDVCEGESSMTCMCSVHQAEKRRRNVPAQPWVPRRRAA